MNNNFNRNPFSSNNNNQTRIVSNYTKASNDGGRVSVNEIKKNMDMLKDKNVNIVTTPKIKLNNTPEQPVRQSEPSPQTNPNQDRLNQMQVARDRMNAFRNIGRN